MVKTVYLVRHGNIPSNNNKIYAGCSDEVLSEDGITQAEGLGKWMQDLDISTIYTSPIRRAIQTAQILNKYIKGELVVEPDLKEMKMGPWEGLSEDEVANKYPSAYQIWLKRPAELRLDGREALRDVQQRALKVINKILKENQNNTTLLVTHVAIIRCLLLYFNHLPLDLYKTIDIPNICTHKVIFGKGNIEIEKIN